MLLAELLEGVKVVKLSNAFFGRMALTQDISISNIRYDSRKVEPGDIFVAIRGTASDGHKYLTEAVARGAPAVVVEDDNALPDTYFIHRSVFKILVPDSRRALAQMAGNYYDHPAARLRLTGITGTNGKTTSTHLVRSILAAGGVKTGLIGTIGYFVGNEAHDASHTTPESLELNALLDEMVRAGCESAAMEVSSHSLAMHRVDGLDFAAGVFTNLTQDHLDYHGTMEEYFRAKKMLFDMLGPDSCAVTNLDDPAGAAIVKETKARVVTYAVRSRADVEAHDVAMDIKGIRMSVDVHGKKLQVASRLTGRFNVENILTSVATGVGLGIDEDMIVAGIAGQDPVRGRFEQFSSPEGWTAVVDYAHTPDALDKCLRTLRDLCPASTGGRVITVFGCGGDRDKTKRPKMGAIAASLSDLSIVTSDNPRTEDPEAIIDDIMAGVPAGSRMERIADRRAAIEAALSMAKPGDVVLLAGKGHEDYQIVGKEKRHFSDKEEVARVIERSRR